LEHGDGAAAWSARQPVSFGKDLPLIVVYGAVILALLEGRKSHIASIARYLQLPHETTRRYLKECAEINQQH